MKGLAGLFDTKRFFDGVLLESKDKRPWLEFETKKPLGTKIEVVIVKDDIAYDQKEGQIVNNQYERLTLKVKGDVNVPMGAIVTPVNPVCKIYGKYNENLSVVCDGIEVISQNP